MKRSQLLEALGCDQSREPDCDVTAVTEDSRRVTAGAVFVAVRGEHVDGHAFAQEAAAAGAVAIIGARSGLHELCGVPYAYTDNPRRVLGETAHRLAGNPSTDMTVAGFTGTNGKSSCVALAKHVFDACGYTAAGFGTLGYAVGQETMPVEHTTPFAEDLAVMFARARDAGVTHVFMEVSSHALEQERVAGIAFNVGVWTNLTQDHLDYHRNMAAYRRAKLKLFEHIAEPGGFTVVNVDDPSAQAFIDASKVTCYTFGNGGQCRPQHVRLETHRTRFGVVTPWGTADVEIPLVGRHNMSNALAVIAVCGGLGLPLQRIVDTLATAPPVPGRFEHVDAGQDFQVIVDYAHTEDGLRNVLDAAREVCDGRLILVFGCGGDRDKTKRPKMGRAAVELADFSIVTSDNPRSEEPERILLDIEAGMQRAGAKKGDDYLAIVDRAEAIRSGIQMARPRDLVMIAGKGHEDYQILGATRIHFDDREVAYAVLQGK